MDLEAGQAGRAGKAKPFYLAADKGGQDRTIVCICPADGSGANILTRQASGSDTSRISGMVIPIRQELAGRENIIRPVFV